MEKKNPDWVKENSAIKGKDKMSNNFMNRINKLEKIIPEKKPRKYIPLEVFCEAIDNYNKTCNKNVTIEDLALILRKVKMDAWPYGCEDLTKDELIDLDEILDRVREIEHL